MKKNNLLMTIVGVGLSLAVLYGTVWVASKGWKKGQEN